MKALILAAGEGKRMLPLTETRPKPMLSVANKPVLEHIINSIKGAGIKEIIAVVDEGKLIEDYFKDGGKLGVKLSFVIQKERLGTAHAISMAQDYLDEDFVVLNGDHIFKIETIKDLVKSHKNAGTLSLVESEEQAILSSVKVQGNKVLKIVEKPKPGEQISKLASVGSYAFSPELFKAIKKTGKSERGEYELPSAIQQLIEDGSEVNWVKAGHFVHITYPWDLLLSNKEVLDSAKAENKAEVEDNVTIKGKLIAGKGTLIRSGAYIEGPVMIGENCTIGPNCFIRAYSTIGNNCRIGQSVEVKNSIIMDGTYLPHQNYAGDSIIGSNCNIAAGTILANLRFDDQNVKVNVKGELTDTKLRKFGAVLGDNVKTGISSIVMPGKKIGSNAVIYPGKVVNKDVESGEEFK